jgi:4,5-dihydroxyphthalate decarboxylase
VLSGDEHVAEYQPPPNVVPAEPGADLRELVASGELAAAIGIDGFPPLLPDAAEAGFAALRARRHYPINHLVVVRDELVGLAPAIFAAFEEAKNRYVASGRLDPVHERVAAITGSDPLPYGLEPNRAVVEELIEHALRQRILRLRPDVGSLFAPV